MEQDHVESSKEVMQRLLDERFLYAKSLPGACYKHIFRSKSFLELIRLSLLNLAISCFYATEMAFIAPILFYQGLSYSVMSMIWALPPIVGMLVIPVIASVSDRCRLAWGRRRPEIFAVGIVVLLAMMLIPCGEVIAQTIGLDHVVWVVTLIALGVTVTDTGAGASIALCQTYALEVCPISDHGRVLNMMVFMAGVGFMLGSTIGSIDWSALPLGLDSVNNETIVFLATWIIFLVCLVSTLTSYREVPLPVMEKDAMLRPVTHHEIDIHLNRQQQVDCPLIPTKEASEQLQCRQLIHSIIHMPLAMKKLYFTHLLSVMGSMTFFLFLTDFVATKVFHGDVKAPKESEEFKMYEAGVRYGCSGMMLNATSVALFSLVIKRLMDRFGTRKMYIFAFMIQSCSMLCLGFVHHRVMVMISCVTAAIQFSSMNSIPYLLLSHYHSKNAFGADTLDTSINRQKRGLGVDVSLLNSILFLAQLILGLVLGSIIDALGTCTVIVFIASGCSFLAAISASTITYMDL